MLSGDAARPWKNAARVLLGSVCKSLSRRYGYSVIKIKTMASDFIYQCELAQERRTCHPATSHHKRLNIHADSRNGFCP